jgi:hypothetical protein
MKEEYSTWGEFSGMHRMSLYSMRIILLGIREVSGNKLHILNVEPEYDI